MRAYTHFRSDIIAGQYSIRNIVYLGISPRLCSRGRHPHSRLQCRFLWEPSSMATESGPSPCCSICGRYVFTILRPWMQHPSAYSLAPSNINIHHDGFHLLIFVLRALKGVEMNGLTDRSF